MNIAGKLAVVLGSLVAIVAFVVVGYNAERRKHSFYGGATVAIEAGQTTSIEVGDGGCFEIFCSEACVFEGMDLPKGEHEAHCLAPGAGSVQVSALERRTQATVHIAP